MNKIKNQFLSRELSLKLRELGFEEDTLAYYVGKDPEIFLCDEKYVKQANFKLTSKIAFRAPLYQQAFDFFREKYNLNSYIKYQGIYGYYYVIDYDEYGNDKENCGFHYEEARLKCLTKLIEIVK